MSPIERYLEEFAGLLHRPARRRAIVEAREHLLDAALSAAERGIDADAAQRLAIQRFGSAEQVARHFNAVRRRSRTMARRAAAVVVASAATASVGTATVWALEPGVHRGHAPAVHQIHHPRPHHARDGGERR